MFYHPRSKWSIFIVCMHSRALHRCQSVVQRGNDVVGGGANNRKRRTVKYGTALLGFDRTAMMAMICVSMLD